MGWYQHDIPTMERKVANYKSIKIPDSDPFLLFKILQEPSSNDLSEYCNFDNPREQSRRMSASGRRLILPT